MAIKVSKKVDTSKMSEDEKRDLALSLIRLGVVNNKSGKRQTPITDDELWWYIKEEIGDEVPRVAVCEDHDAPFDFMKDYYFERERAILVMSSRESGKTRGTAIINYIFAETKDNLEVCTFADIEAQSNKSYTYIKNFVYTKNDKGEKVLKSSVSGDPLRKETIFKNGSKLEVIIGSKSGVNSPHPQKVHADEIDLMDEEIFYESRSMSSSKTLSDGTVIKAQDIATSTRKSNKGLVQKIINEVDSAKKHGLRPPWRVYRSCIYEIAQEVPNCRKAPKDQREARLTELGKDPCELCECNKVAKGEMSEGVPRTLDLLCKGKLFRSRGWMRYDDIVGKFTQNSPQVWVAQLECRRPMADGLYLPTWSRERYCVRGYEPRPEYGLIWQGIDWGGAEASAVLWIQGPLHQPLQVNNTIGTMTVIPQGSYVIFKEINEAAMGATRLADKVVRQEIQYKNRFGGGWRVKARFADMAGRQQREDWREHNPPLRTVWYIARDFDPTVECLQALVSDSLLYVDDQSCPGTCDDFESWRSKDNKEVHDSSCLIGNTLVKTYRGNIPIKDVVVGDEVYTRRGLRQVEWSGVTDIRFLKRVEFSDGSELVGTDNHPVWVVGKGWVRLGLLRPSDTIISWDKKGQYTTTEKQSSTEGFRGTDTRIPTSGASQHIFMGLSMGAATHTIGSYGKIITEKFILGMLFIMPILITITMILRILFVLPRASILGFIEKQNNGVRIHKSIKSQLREELKFMRKLSSLKNKDRAVAKYRGRKSQLLNASALYAEKNTKLRLHILNFVKENVNPNGIKNMVNNILIWKIRNASYAKRNFQQKNIITSDIVPMTVVKVLDVKDLKDNYGMICRDLVYDLTIEKDHEFYANNILVHNSHNPAAARYGLKNITTIMKRYKNTTIRSSLQPVVVAREGDASNLPGIAVSSATSADYSSERWRESLGGGPIGTSRGGKEPWMP